MQASITPPALCEADLFALLERAAGRLRLAKALRFALGAMGLGLVLAGTLIAAQRLAGLSPHLILPALTIAPVCALALGLLVWFRYRPELVHVALLLDRLAGTHEHLVTWYQFRVLGNKAPVRQEILTAQRNATLIVASTINPKKLLPLRLPDWSRALWLALVLLCCALLVPPHRASTLIAKSRADSAQELTLAQPGSSNGDPAAPTPSARVQPLSPTELLQLQLLASDPESTTAQKAAALRELQQKIGAVPESELAPDVRDLLTTLRQEQSGPETEKAGSQTVLTLQDGKMRENPDNRALQGAAKIPVSPEKVFTSISHSMPDVQEQLSRYYASLKQPTNRSQP